MARGASPINALAAVNSSWQMAGTGDFNGSGEPDILWRNASTGGVELWNSNGSGGFTYEDLGDVHSSWQVEGTGDFNGSGADGILWRNASTGGVELWNSNGSGGFTYEDLGAVNSSWQVEGTGDFTGSGEDGILWRNPSTGDVELWNPNGSGGFTYRRLGRCQFQLAGRRNRRFQWQWRRRHPVAQLVDRGCRALELERLGGLHLRRLGCCQLQLAGRRDWRFQRERRSRDSVAQLTSGDVEFWNPNGSGGFTYHDLGVVVSSWSVQKPSLETKARQRRTSRPFNWVKHRMACRGD